MRNVVFGDNCACMYGCDSWIREAVVREMKARQILYSLCNLRGKLEGKQQQRGRRTKSVIKAIARNVRDDRSLHSFIYMYNYLTFCYVHYILLCFGFQLPVNIPPTQ